MNRIIIFTISILLLQEVLSQSQESGNLYFTGITKPYLVSNHPLGLFITRIDHNFNIHPPKKIQLNIGIHNGNVWQPLVKAYKPLEPSVRTLMEQYIWYSREGVFDKSVMSSDSLQYHADAVIRAFPVDIRFRLSDNHELAFRIRSFVVTRGEIPFSTITSDGFLEWFHSNIAGGEDPFARKYYGFNKADIRYVDKNGESIKLGEGDFLVPGIEVHYYYYPHFNTTGDRGFFMNAGVHTGTNISRYNRTIDLGISSSAMKTFSFQDQRNLTLGFGVGLMRQGILQYGEHVNIFSNGFIYSLEGEVAYCWKIKEDSHYSIGLNYYFQNPYNKREEFDYIVLTGDRITTHWHYAFTHLYTSLQSWSLIFSYSRKRTFLLYVREDFKVNNAPDIQTGIEVQIPF
ncbi:MAG: hypothetical protein AMS27_13405 [Bacteroides sp. SM23_62_1]|nr:MAG: hypothetical protein AMS27_13405 [Bacteroides sp. SM23_62_1]